VTGRTRQDRSRILSSLVVLAIGLVMPELALAEGAVEREEGDARARAQALFVQGLELTRTSDYGSALGLFEESLRLFPTAGALYNSAQCLRILHRYPEAIAALESYRERYDDEIDRGRRAEIEEELARLRRVVGEVRITVVGAEGARVLVDGREVGTSPLPRPVMVTAGRHEVEARAEGYRSPTESITVAGETTATVELVLSPEAGPAGSLVVRVPLPGVDVAVDGEPAGRTPLDSPLALPAGPHVVALTRAGYAPVRTAVEVVAGEEVVLERRLRPEASLPAALRGTLVVVPSEPDAQVLLDGEPMEPGPVPVGPHVLEIRREGFQDWTWQGEVIGGADLRLEATLQPTGEHVAHTRVQGRRWIIAASVLAATAVAILGTTVGLHFWVEGMYADWEQERDELDALFALPLEAPDRPEQETFPGLYDMSDDDVSDIRMMSSVIWALGGTLAGAAAVTSVILFALRPRARPSAELSFAPTAGGMSLGLSGWW